MNKLILSTTAALVILATSLSMNLHADSDSKASATAQKNAKITLSQAITIAEQATGGKSTEAEFELEEGKAIYEVEVSMADGSEIEVEIDAQSGAILSQEVDDEHKEDDKDDNDKDDKA